MGTYNITAEDMYLLKQSTKELYSKVELLNSEFKIVDQLEGNLISDDLSVSSDSSVRRTYNCSLFVTDSTFEIARDTKIWIDRMIRPYVGVKNMMTGNIVWYLMGTYKISSTSVSYDATTHTLDLSCNDLMCTLDAEFSGCVEGYNFKIPASEDVRTSIIGLLKDAGVSQYKVDLIDEQIPYDLEFDLGSSYYDMLNGILELWVESWQMYFDIYGTFIWEPIPIAIEDEIVLDNETMQYLLIQETRDDNFSNVFNKTIIYGKMIEPDYYTEVCTYNNGTYSANVGSYYDDSGELIETNSYTEYRNFDKIAIKIPSVNSSDTTYINANKLGNIMVCNDNGDAIEPNTLEADLIYVFKYRKTNPNKQQDFYLLGQYLPYGEYTEDSDEVLYSTKNVGRVLLHEIELDSIYSDDLARQRAAYETYLTCRRRDTISLDMMAVYWLDVNEKVEYRPTGSNETYQYLVQDISLNSTDGTMSVTLQRFYDDYTVFYKKMHGTYKE